MNRLRADPSAGRVTRREFLGRAAVAGAGLFVPALCARPAQAEPKAADRPTGPWNLEALRRPPQVTTIQRDGALTSLSYEGEPSRGRPTRVFAYLARPEKAEGKLPAVALVHGGGGKAFPEWAELWARRGYVALAMDLAGHGPDGRRLPDGGPEQDDQTKFADVPAEDAWTYHAVAAVVRGVSLLAGLPEIDAGRLGITGISWGGYLTCIVAGLDDRLKVAVPVYGCGFLAENSYWLPVFQKMPEGQRRRWVEDFDPSRYLGQARMPVLFVNGTNDFAYPLDSYQKSYRLVRDRALCVTVNMPHGHRQGWAPAEIGLFVDQHLRGGTPLARVGSVKRDGGRVEVAFRTEVLVTRAAVHVTADTGPWKERKWQTRPADLTETTARAELPQDRPLVHFLTLTDSRGATVSTEHEVLPKE
jgi:dienelactone hydrolase